MRATTDGPWLWLNRQAFRLAAQEGPLPALVLVALASIESETPKERKASFPASLEQIANAAGIAKRSAQNGLKVLVKIGLVSVESGLNAGCGLVRNRYRLEAVCTPQNDAASGGGGMARGAIPMARGAIPPMARGAIIYKEKEEEGRPPTGPTRPSSKKETRESVATGCPARLNAAPAPVVKTDMVKTDNETDGDPWEDYVRQQTSLAGVLQDEGHLTKCEPSPE